MRWPRGTAGWVLGIAAALVVLWGVYFAAFSSTADKASDSQAQQEVVTQSNTSPTKQQNLDDAPNEERGGEHDAP